MLKSKGSEMPLNINQSSVCPRKRGLEQRDKAETLDSNQHVFTSVLQKSLSVYGPTEAGDRRRELNDTLNKQSTC